MIIDIHAHLWDEELPSKSWWDTFVKISASLSGRPEELSKRGCDGQEHPQRAPREEARTARLLTQ